MGIALSRATEQLGVIMAPRLANGVFRHVHIYEIAPRRFLLNLTIDSGFVKTLVVELETNLRPDRLENACRLINERFHGFTLEQMCTAGDDVFADVESYALGVIRLFVPSIRKLVREGRDEDIYTEGETNILLKPEFFSKDQAGAVLEILGDRYFGLLSGGLREPDGRGGERTGDGQYRRRN